jgi:hypothetical protein
MVRAILLFDDYEIDQPAELDLPEPFEVIYLPIPRGNRAQVSRTPSPGTPHEEYRLSGVGADGTAYYRKAR